MSVLRRSLLTDTNIYDYALAHGGLGIPLLDVSHALTAYSEHYIEIRDPPDENPGRIDKCVVKFVLKSVFCIGFLARSRKTLINVCPKEVPVDNSCQRSSLINLPL